MGLLPPNPLSPSDENLDSLMQQAKALMERKDKLELQLRELDDFLKNSGVDMNEPLVDVNDFPRSDIDVASISTNRNLIFRLRNDHKSIMKDIEKVLHMLHEAKRQTVDNLQPTATATATATGAAAEINAASNEGTTSPEIVVDNRSAAFAIVNAVAPDSPAYIAGLRRNDHILKFGHVIASGNHQELQALNELVSLSDNLPLEVTVSREGSGLMELIVTPRPGWGGRGSLGCHLLPL